MSEFNQNRYIAQYIKDNYDVVRLQLPKGYKDKLKVIAEANGYKSMNECVRHLIDSAEERT